MQEMQKSQPKQGSGGGYINPDIRWRRGRGRRGDPSNSHYLLYWMHNLRGNLN